MDSPPSPFFIGLQPSLRVSPPVRYYKREPRPELQAPLRHPYSLPCITDAHWWQVMWSGHKGYPAGWFWFDWPAVSDIVEQCSLQGLERRGTGVEQARKGLLEAISHKAREELLCHPKPQIGSLPLPALTIWMQITPVYIYFTPHVRCNYNSSSQCAYLPTITIYVLVLHAWPSLDTSR